MTERNSILCLHHPEGIQYSKDQIASHVYIDQQPKWWVVTSNIELLEEKEARLSKHREFLVHLEKTSAVAIFKVASHVLIHGERLYAEGGEARGKSLGILAEKITACTPFKGTVKELRKCYRASRDALSDFLRRGHSVSFLDLHLNTQTFLNKRLKNQNAAVADLIEQIAATEGLALRAVALEINNRWQDARKTTLTSCFRSMFNVVSAEHFEPGTPAPAKIRYSALEATSAASAP